MKKVLALYFQVCILDAMTTKKVITGGSLGALGRRFFALRFDGYAFWSTISRSQ